MRSTQHRTYSAPNSRSHLDTRGTGEPTLPGEKTYLHKPCPSRGAPRRVGHSKETCWEQEKKNRSSPQEAQCSFARHTRQWQQDALQLGRGRDLGGVFQSRGRAWWLLWTCNCSPHCSVPTESRLQHWWWLSSPQWSHWLLLPCCPLHPCCRYSLRPPFHPACGGGRGAPGGGGGGGAPGGFQ